ncbi:alpha-glucan water dikinase, chloroplastic-like [Bidens hawaiensis]|uniref:alpha-glucan water dikinase, chloroplastic-like n=1 Tax=Bidens hawaiensis TaxID=980011 RepID=UPI00404A5C24
MSNNSVSLRHGLLLHQIKANANANGNTLMQAQSISHIRRFSLSLLLCNDYFRRQRLSLRKSNSRTSRVLSVSTQAVLATDPSSKVGGRFKLQGDIEMQVDVQISSVALLEIQITNGTDNLYLHWGCTRNRNEKWVLPSRCPEGTKVFNNEALRTPFLKSGSNSFLKVEINDPAIETIEFLVVDERQDRWYKDNGQNFYVKLPPREKLVSNVVVPEDLVQIQAYLRWERNGKQTYTPEQEKKEFEETRKELQKELEKGNSLDDIRKKITNGEIKTKVLKKVVKENLTPERINRKKRDVMQLLKTPTPVSAKDKISIKQKDLSALQIFSKAIEEQSGTNILNKKTYRPGDKQLLVLVTNDSSKTRVHLATDMEGPLTLHWALSEKAGEWLASSRIFFVIYIATK